MNATQATKQRAITLPSGKRVSLGAYVAAWRKLKTIDPETEIMDWDWFPVTARDVLRQISDGVHDRINRHLTHLSAVAAD